LAVGYEDTRVDRLDARTLAVVPRPDLDGIDNGSLIDVAWSRGGTTLVAAGKYGPVIVAWAGGGAGARRALRPG